STSSFPGQKANAPAPFVRWTKKFVALALYAAAFGRPAAIMRNGRYVADRGHIQADRLQRAQRRLTARARTADFDLERAHAVLDGFLRRIFGSDLRRVWRRFARALEAE